jgi:hypothetical protein
MPGEDRQAKAPLGALSLPAPRPAKPGTGNAAAIDRNTILAATLGFQDTIDILLMELFMRH